MDCRILVRFIGVQQDLEALWDAFMEHFPEAELPSVDSGEWYSVEEYMTDEYECRFEELPESELLAGNPKILAIVGNAVQNIYAREAVSNLPRFFREIYVAENLPAREFNFGNKIGLPNICI